MKTVFFLIFCATLTIANNQTSTQSIDQIQVSIPKVTFDDLAGIVSKDIKDIFEILKEIRLAYDKKEIIELEESLNPLLFYGLPGVGKTTQAKALAGEAGWYFYSLEVALLSDAYVGTGPKTIKSIFDSLKKAEIPIVVFLDEIDSIARKRNEHMSEEGLKTINTLLIEIEKLKAEMNPFVLVIGATNRYDMLDEAFISRFGTSIELSLPNEKQRYEIVKYHCKKQRVSLSSQNMLKEIVKHTHNFSGRDINNLIYNIKRSCGTYAIERQDILEALKKIRIPKEQKSWNFPNLNTILNYADLGLRLANNSIVIVSHLRG